MHMYLAARYSRHEEMVEHATLMEADGHKITSRWIRGGHEQHEGDRHAVQAENERFAIEDIEDLTKCDIVVSFTEELDANPKRPSKGGRHSEFGMGVALNKRMVIIGPNEHVFHYLPLVERYDSVAEFLSVLDEEENGG